MRKVKALINVWISTASVQRGKPGKRALMTHANSDGPNERAHPCSLI